MKLELKSGVFSKFCANCGALIQIERRNDKPEHCALCVVYHSVIESCNMKTKLLLQRHNEAAENLRNIRQRVAEDIERQIKIN